MVKRIVLTGGPCAGKTTVLSKIEQDLCERGYKVFIISESATELINGGITPHNSGVGLLNFQKLIMSYQYQKEEIYNRAAIISGDEKIVIIYDRGLMDNKGYINDIEFEMVLDDLSYRISKDISVFDIVSRYDMVIHLVTSAGNKGYILENNKARYESEKEAIMLDEKIMNAWSLHNNLKIVDSTDNFYDKIDSVLNLVHTCLGEKPMIKREKKFLVDGNISDEVIASLGGILTEMEQYYIDMDDEGRECRLRKIDCKYGSNYYYVVYNRGENGQKFISNERIITEEEFERMIDFGVVSSIMKKRICFIYNKQFCKLDLFSDGFMLLEVEYNNELDDVVIPEGFNVLRDVTDDDDYRNINLGSVSLKYSRKRVKDK